MVVIIIAIVILSQLIMSCGSLNRAKYYMSEEQYLLAYKELKPLVDREFPEAYYLTGLIILNGYISSYDEKQAIEMLKKAYFLGHKKAAYVLSDIYIRDGHLDDIERKELEELAMEIPDIYIHLARFFYNRGDYESALSYYLKAYSRGLIEAYIGLAKVYLKKGNEERALIYLKQAYRSGEKRAALILGRISERKALTYESRGCFILKASDPEEYFNLVYKHNKRKLDLYSKALEWYSKVTDDLEAKYRYLRILWKLENVMCDKYREILDFAKLGVKPAINDTIKLFYKERRCDGVNIDFNEIEMVLKEVHSEIKAEVDVSEGDDRQKVSELYHLEDSFEIMKEKCLRGDADAELDIAKYYMEKNIKKDLSVAVLVYHAKVRNIPKAMVSLYKVYLENNKEREAINIIKKAIDMGYTPAKIEYAKYLLSKGELEQSLDLLTTVEGNCNSYILIGNIYMGKYGDYIKVDAGKALEYYDKAVANGCPKAYYNKAHSLYTMRDYKGAIENLTIYLNDVDDKNGNILAYKIYYDMGDRDKAFFHLKKAIIKGYIPSSKDILHLFDYFNKDEIVNINEDLYGRFLLAKARKYKNNFELSFCLAYKAATMNAPGSVRFLLNLYLSISHDKEEFIKRFASDKNICNRFTRSY